jgi:hypothetical protein
MSAGETSPLGNFPVRDLAGKEHFAAESHAKATVWLFITHDCSICNSYAPEIARIANQYAARGVHVNLVYAESGLDLATLNKHARDHNFHGALFYEGGNRLPKAFGISTTPEVVVIDAKGRVVYQGRIDNRYVSIGRERREITTHDLRDALDATLLGRPVATPRTRAIGCVFSPPS